MLHVIQAPLIRGSGDALFKTVIHLIRDRVPSDGGKAVTAPAPDGGHQASCEGCRVAVLIPAAAVRALHVHRAFVHQTQAIAISR